MTQSQIQYFLVTAQEMSISKAADLLFVSQPAVSKQISLLEEELGVLLFERRNQSIIITEAGKAFEKLFTNFLSDIKDTMNQFQAKAQEPSGEFTLGIPEVWDIGTFYPQMCASLEEKYPSLHMNAHGYNLNQLLYALRRGEVDAAISFGSFFSGLPEFSIQPLLQLDGILIFSEHNPLAKKENLSLEDFKNSIFYITTPPNMNSSQLELFTACKACGFTPKLEFVPTLSATLMKLQSGRGAFFTTEWAMIKETPMFRYITLNVKRDIAVISSAHRQTATIDLVISDIIKYFHEKSPALTL